MDPLTGDFLIFEKMMTFYVQAVTLSTMRFWGVFFIFPLFVWAGIPPIVTMTLAFCFSLPALPGMVSVLSESNINIWPLTSPQIDETQIFSGFKRYNTTLISLKEFLLGVMLGFFPAAFFYGLIVVGELVDQSRGDIGGRSNSGGNLQMTNCGTIFFLCGATLFVISGEFLHFIRLIYRSYEVWPLFEISGFITPERMYFYLELSINMLYSMIKIGIPFLIIMWSFDIQSLYQAKTDKKFQAQEYQQTLKNFVFIFFFIFYLSLTDNEKYGPTMAISSSFSMILEGGSHGAPYGR
ncbi:MAG: flagellar biosynthetic protein FliR [Pseudomonadota bacterium]